MAESGRKIYHVTLDDDERRFLRETVDSGGTPQARPCAPAGRPGPGGQRTHRCGYLLCPRHRRSDGRAGAQAVRARRPGGGAGTQGQLNRKKRTLDGTGEAELVKLACSPPPDGLARWTLQRGLHS